MLLIADLHLTDRVRDEYRWEIFDFVESYYKKNEDKNLIILGDLTDSKDHHSAKLVNRIVKTLWNLAEGGMDITILKGNHDYIDSSEPYFLFLNQVHPYLKFIVHPALVLIQGEKCLFLPHTRNPLDEWATDSTVQKWKGKSDLVFMHQSVIGSVTSNGYEMQKGLLPSYFDQFRGKVFAGDIHVPQIVGPVEYVGSPYSIRFNDNFKGRVLALHQYPVGKCGVAILPCTLLRNELFTKLRCRRTIDIFNLADLESADAYPEDQVKVRVHVKRSVRVGEQFKQDIRDKCEELGLELCDITLVKDKRFPLRGKKKIRRGARNPTEIISDFSKRTGIGKRRRLLGTRLTEGGSE